MIGLRSWEAWAPYIYDSTVIANFCSEAMESVNIELVLL